MKTSQGEVCSLARVEIDEQVRGNKKRGESEKKTDEGRVELINIEFLFIYLLYVIYSLILIFISQKNQMKGEST